MINLLEYYPMTDQYAEIWKQIPEYENYEVSDYGNVRNRKTKRNIKWEICSNQRGRKQVRIGLYKNGKQKHFTLGRLMLSVFKGLDYFDYSLECDHINLNPLDNNLSNLRAISREENNQNKELRSDNTTGYRGVCYDEKTQKYRARICVNGKKKHLGYFDDPIDARNAYARACQKHRNPDIPFDNSHFFEYTSPAGHKLTFQNGDLIEEEELDPEQEFKRIHGHSPRSQSEDSDETDSSLSDFSD